MTVETDNKRIGGVLVTAYVLWLVLAVLVVTQPPMMVQTESTEASYFVLASWDYPDAYGQGVYGYKIYENSTGSWVQVDSELHTYEETTVWEWGVGVAVELKLYCWFNSTLTGASTFAEGKNLLRHNVTVTTGSTTVFEQSNFTYAGAAGGGIDGEDESSDPMWLYYYTVVLNFLPEASTYYVATVTYEVFW
jgi:hypothetical protein